ncbi:class I SAM-dependent methyltransferase [Marinicella sp. W31]|uniref:class I SAM-dependent methyltransferase n=1 Tax=Marinicella sp. W31 TaxID=3023713 RepID=UPI0037577095
MKISVQSTRNNVIVCQIDVVSEMLFDVDFQVDLATDAGQQSFHIRQKGWDISWLPKGSYSLIINLSESDIEATNYRVRVVAMDNANGKPRVLSDCVDSIVVSNPRKVLSPDIYWDLQAQDFDINELSWKKGYSDWFYLHFDHAARVIKELMFNNSDKLKGKILDVGCGDGVTDLGLFLRMQPELLVGIDPFKGFEGIEAACQANHIPEHLVKHENLRFTADSGNEIPFDDDSFDVVLSWGSLEHIAGGYDKALAEITRVLKKDGILFAHPGLFYGEVGNHLREFFDDPFIHLKIPEEELKQRLMTAKPNYMERLGKTYPPEDYWRWYKELNPITVDSMERELRALGYEPWRVALRSSNVVEYTSELQKYSMNDLAVAEMYGTFILKSK